MPRDNAANSQISPDLVADLKGGGNLARAAVAEIFRQLQPRALRYLLRNGADAATADDLCQDLFVRIMEKIDDYRGDARFDAWAFGILRNMWIDRLRTNVRMVALPEDGEIEIGQHVQFTTADRHSNVLAEKRAISALDAFALADPASAHLLELRVFEGWDYDALATYYGTTPAAMRERVSYVRKKLERFLGPLIDFLREDSL